MRPGNTRILPTGVAGVNPEMTRVRRAPGPPGQTRARNSSTRRVSNLVASASNEGSELSAK